MNNVAFPKIYLYKRIVDAKLFIDSNFKEKINLGKVANEACYSKFHFHRVFKECYHTTPYEYLISLRLKEAKSLLSQKYSTKDVCHMVGFESVSSFIKLFKKKELLTPAQYAKMTQNLNLNVNLKPLDYIPSGYAEYLGWKNE